MTTISQEHDPRRDRPGSARPRAAASELTRDRRGRARPESADVYRGLRVVDGLRRHVGRITDVLFDHADVARWAVVSPGPFRPEHYMPLEHTYLSFEGELVVPFDRKVLMTSPRAARDHVMSGATEDVVERYYRLVA